MEVKLGLLTEDKSGFSDILIEEVLIVNEGKDTDVRELLFEIFTGAEF